MYDDMPGLVDDPSLPPPLVQARSTHPSAGGTPWHGRSASIAPSPAPGVIPGGFGAGAPTPHSHGHSRHRSDAYGGHGSSLRRTHSTPSRRHGRGGLEFPPSPSFPHPTSAAPSPSHLHPGAGGFDPFSVPAAAYDAAAANSTPLPGFHQHQQYQYPSPYPYPWPMAPAMSMSMGMTPPSYAHPSPYHTTTPATHAQDPLEGEDVDDDWPSHGEFVGEAQRGGGVGGFGSGVPNGAGGGFGGFNSGGGGGGGGNWDPWDLSFRTPGSGSSAGTGPSPSASVINGFATGPRSSYKKPEDWREGFTMSKSNSLGRVFSLGLGGFTGKPQLNKLLDAKSGSCSWDVRRPPEAFQVLPSMKPLEYLQLQEGAMIPEPIRMKITHPSLPWTIYVDASSAGGGKTCIVTIGHLLSSIYGELMRSVNHRDFWNDLLGEEDRKRIYDAWARRCKGDAALSAQGIKRVDFLLDRFVFEGLKRVKDGWEMKLKSGRKERY